MRDTQNWNDGWVFVEGFEPGYPNAPIDGAHVDLPHNAAEFAFSYGDEKCFQKPFTYQKMLNWDGDGASSETILRFEGAMADAVVFINGVQIAAHPDGYTPFEARLTKHLRLGDNIITVKIDGSENPAIPPFGGRIDYLTYAGIYRDVFLCTRPNVSIGLVKVETPDVLSAQKSMRAMVRFDQFDSSDWQGVLQASLCMMDGEVVAQTRLEVGGTEIEFSFDQLDDIALWDIEHPNLYRLDLVLKTEFGEDQKSTPFGFRQAQFKPDGFWLNGKKLKLMGLNRHQSFPFSGYGLGRVPQEKDAEIVKFELGCNVVRTSHYPQSPYFLDHCDKIGLLVLTELPGWQHIGDEAWQDASVENLKNLIERDWNHPSIITWGVRINESDDHHAFYTRTNELARCLDPTRQTSGIRKHAGSELLEDIYTMNDFSQGLEEMAGGNRIVLMGQQEQTLLDRQVPYMVTECNGHMFPTKAYDPELRQAEHVMRHLNVLNAAFGAQDSAGVIGWCMFDYNTHKDFGAGDRICHHGVMNMYREPKFAAYAYASQMEPAQKHIMQPVTFYARGERNIGGILPLIVLTNLDEIELRFAHGVKKRFAPASDQFPHLPHPPVVISIQDVGEGDFGMWGVDWADFEIAGYLDGEEVTRAPFVAAPVPTLLEVVPDQDRLDAASKQEVRVIVRALDQAGNKLPFLFEPVDIQIEGPAQLMGPDARVLQAGSTGFWLRATGTPGEIKFLINAPSFGATQLSIKAI